MRDARGTVTRMSFSDFLDRAGFLLDAGCSAQVTSVCVRSMPEEEWVSFTTKIVLGPENVLRADLGSVLVNLPNLRVIRASVPGTQVRQSLADVAEGILRRAAL